MKPELITPRTLEPEERAQLLAYAEAVAAKKAAEDVMKIHREAVENCLLREDLDSNTRLALGPFQFSYTRSKVYSDRLWEKEVEVEVNGQQIFASVNHLKAAVSRTSSFLKGPEYVIREPLRVTVR